MSGDNNTLADDLRERISDLEADALRYRAALDTIANKPIGDAEATDREILTAIAAIARAALAKAAL